MKQIKKSAVCRLKKDGKRDGRYKPNDGRGGGRKPGIKVLNVSTGIVESRYLSWFLHQLNHNRPDDWIPFNASDWRSGWETYINKRQYKLIEAKNEK